MVALRHRRAGAVDDDADQFEVVGVTYVDGAVAFVPAQKADMAVPHVQVFHVFRRHQDGK